MQVVLGDLSHIGLHAEQADYGRRQQHAQQRQRYRDDRAPDQRLAREAAGRRQIPGAERLRYLHRRADRQRAQRSDEHEDHLERGADASQRHRPEPGDEHGIDDAEHGLEQVLADHWRSKSQHAALEAARRAGRRFGRCAVRHLDRRWNRLR